MDKQIFNFYKNALTGEIANNPLCREFQTAWRRCGDDKEQLMRLALRQQSAPYLAHACYTNLGLSKEYIETEFADYLNNSRIFNDVEGVEGFTYAMFVNATDTKEMALDVIQMLWCNCEVSIKMTKCPVIYISNMSDVHIVCNGYNSPRIYLFDESKVTIEGDETCEVIVYKYSDDCKVERADNCKCEVKEFRKTLRL